MNENVTNKTPKRRRWIARLLVSALCILLASSLLFVSVVAENIELVAQFSGNYGFATSPYNNYVYPFGSNLLVYSNSYMVYLQVGSSVKSVFDIRSSEGYDSTYLSDNISFYYDGFFLYGLTTRKTSTDLLVSFYTFTIVDNEIISASAVNVSTYVSGTHYFPFTTFVVVDGNVYSFYLYGSSSSTTIRYLAFLKLSGTDLTYYYYANLGSGLNSYYNSASFQNGNLILGLYKNSKCYLFNIFSNSFSNVEPPSPSTTGQNYVFDYEGDTYYVNSNVLCKWNIDTVSFEKVGAGVSGYYFAAYNGVLTSYSLPVSMSISYTVYTGLPTSEPPPESSDETTSEPPPESSDESSEEPVEGGTKVYSVVNSSKHEPSSFVTTEVGSIDTNNAVSIQAYLGNFMDSSLEEWDDSPHRLSIRVLYEDGIENVYNFDFNAYGFYSSATPPASIIEGFSYPSYVGKWFDIPYELGDSLYFSTSSQGGHFLVYNSTFQCTVNLATFDSYARIDFVDAENFSIVVFNDDPVGDRVSFDQGVIRYKKFYTDELGGSSSASNWYYPEEGTSIRIDGLQSGSVIPLTSIRVETNLDYTGMRDESKYEDYMSRVDDDLNDFSINQELINSLANGNFGQADFSGDMSNEFIDAIGRFDNIVNSSGGSTIFRFFGYMWSVHPLASTMVAIVASLAVIGFVVRKV